MEKMERTEPLTDDIKELDPNKLVAGRYGTQEMIDIWGPEKTFEYSLRVQAAAIEIMAELYPDIIPHGHATELVAAANLDVVKPDRIREIEAVKKHDVIAINTAWGEQVSPEAAAHINKARASADTTETAKALQIKDAMKAFAKSTENARDIILERSYHDWLDDPHIDTSHLFHALPTVFGRPFSFFAEMLQSDLDELKHTAENSLVGKWADATGNHHSASALGIDGRALQKAYCERLGLKYMDAPAQIPGREYLFDVVASISRFGITFANLGRYIRTQRSHDVGTLSFPKGAKGSSSMPHKDMMGGNPIAEEQEESFHYHMLGALATSMASGKFDYARDLSGSASDRILFENMFKFADLEARKLANVSYKLQLNSERARERVGETFGVVTAQQVMTYLTDGRKTNKPMTREQASDYTGKLATQAYESKKSFIDVLLSDSEITSRLDGDTIREISDPYSYIGSSKEIVKDVFKKYHGRKTFK